MYVQNKRPDICGLFSPNSPVCSVQEQRPFTHARYHPELISRRQAERSGPLPIGNNQSPPDNHPLRTYLCTCTHMRTHACVYCTPSLIKTHFWIMTLLCLTSSSLPACSFSLTKRVNATNLLLMGMMIYSSVGVWAQFTWLHMLEGWGFFYP